MKRVKSPQSFNQKKRNRKIERILADDKKRDAVYQGIKDAERELAELLTVSEVGSSDSQTTLAS